VARQGRDESSGTINVPKAKSARSRKVVLTEEGQQFFRDLAVGRARSEIMIRRNDGAAFGAGHQKRRMGIACERAGIERITFHGLRHTYASQLAMAGVPQAYIRDALGHRTLAMSDRICTSRRRTLPKRSAMPCPRTASRSRTLPRLGEISPDADRNILSIG